MNKLAEEIKNVIDVSEKKIKSLNDRQSANKPLPDKWSAKEILGHLIDSSINNTVRFINGQFTDDFTFSGYDQNKWVEAQNYQNAEWNFLIDLWRSNNLQIVRIVEMIPGNVLNEPHSKHNFDVIEWKEVEKNVPVTLEYLINDYLGHMKHHLKQIFEMHKLEQD
jgi:hypothetical protein